LEFLAEVIREMTAMMSDNDLGISSAAYMAAIVTRSKVQKCLLYAMVTAVQLPQVWNENER
jgi:hypothetical protein